MPGVAVERILCPVDLSEQSQRALQHGLMLARRFHSRLVVLGVLEQVAPLLAGPLETDAGPPEALRRALNGFVEDAGASDVSVTTTVREGAIVASILEEARHLPADLIVMGTHGATGFEHLVLGSVTEKVLRKASCPVLTVPPAAGPAGPAALPFKTILCAIDFSAWSLVGLQFGVSLAEESGGRVLAVHVLDWPFDRVPSSDFTLDALAFRRQLEDQARRELSAAIPADLRARCPVAELVVTGKPYAQILLLAHDEHADAIVMGVHGRSAVNLAFFGSTTNHVVRAAACPVLTIRT